MSELVKLLYRRCRNNSLTPRLYQYFRNGDTGSPMLNRAIEENFGYVRKIKQGLENVYGHADYVVAKEGHYHQWTFGVSTHIKEITIVNSRGTKRKLYDLFPTITVDDNPHICSLEFYLRRSTFARDEFDYHYIHSHVPLTTNKTILNKGCLGTSDIGTALRNTERNSDQLQFDSIAYSIQSFLEWESASGVPHAEIEKIGGGILRRCNYPKAATEEIIEDSPYWSYKYDITTGKVKVELDETNSDFVNEIQNRLFGAYPNQRYDKEVICYKAGDEYFSDPAQSEDQVLKDYIPYRGKKFYITIKKNIDAEQYTRAIHPEVQKFFRETKEATLQRAADYQRIKRFKETLEERNREQGQDGDQRASMGENQIPMSADF